MNASIIRSCLVSGVTMASIAGLVVVPATQQTLLARPNPAVALTAQVEPLAAQTPVALLHQIPDLVNQQLTFHIDFAADFVATGAALLGRQLEIPGTLLRDLQNGTPLPVAVGRALQSVVEIELEAGRELVGFAMDYIGFQVRFIAQVVQDVITASASVLAAVGAAITPTVAAVAPAPSTERAEAMSVRMIPAPPSDAAPDKDQVTETRKVDSAERAIPLSTQDDKTTPPAQGEILSGSSETTNPEAEVTSDKEAPAQRDDAVDGDATDRAESDPEADQPDTTSTADDTRDADRGESAADE
jgi:hypothetical protein